MEEIGKASRASPRAQPLRKFVRSRVFLEQGAKIAQRNFAATLGGTEKLHERLLEDIQVLRLQSLLVLSDQNLFDESHHAIDFVRIGKPQIGDEEGINDTPRLLQRHVKIPTRTKCLAGFSVRAANVDDHEPLGMPKTHLRHEI